MGTHPIFESDFDCLTGRKSSMNSSYLNGPHHRVFKQFRPNDFVRNGDQNWPPRESINGLRFGYFFIRYLWSNPDGPVFMVKLWILILDALFGRFYSFNRNPICRSPNHSSLLSKQQNIVLFLRKPENEPPWERSESIGTSFVNSIVSEEDAQFELYGCFNIWWNSTGIWSTYYYTDTLVRKVVKNFIEERKQDGFHDETIHFIWAGYEADDCCLGIAGHRAEIIHIFYKVMIEHGFNKPFMIILKTSSRTLKVINIALKMPALIVWIPMTVIIMQCSLARKNKKSKIRTAISYGPSSILAIQMYRRLKWRSQIANINMSLHIALERLILFEINVS